MAEPHSSKKAPEGLTILEFSEESVTLSFDPVEGAKGYIICVKNVMEEHSDWKDIPITPEQVNEIKTAGYVLNELMAAHTYQVKVAVYFDEAKQDKKETEVLTFDTQITNCVPESRCCHIS